MEVKLQFSVNALSLIMETYQTLTLSHGARIIREGLDENTCILIKSWNMLNQ